MNTRARRRFLLAGSALATLAVLTACGSTGAATPRHAAGPLPQRPPPRPRQRRRRLRRAVLPWRSPTSTPWPATPTPGTPPGHPRGLFRHVNGELVQNGQVIDLMGFAVAPDGTYYASGHPGAGVDLPQPVGLITSTDAGRTWRVASAAASPTSTP